MKKGRGFSPLEGPRFAGTQMKISNQASPIRDQRPYEVSKRFLTGPVRKISSNGAGFTLVELLVVIAIIALLMSILLPALGRVRKQAKAVMCQANLRQWALIFGMYTEDNDGYFCSGAYVLWTEATRSYYEDPDLRCCPMAVKRWGEGGRGTFAAWDIGAIGAPVTWTGDRKGDYGSYGLNEWLYNPPEDIEYLWESPTVWNWRHINVRGTANIPMFLDCWWLGCGPTHKDEPPAYEGDMIHDNTDEMKLFCLNRHDKTVNGCFMDFSVRKIPLKCLWKFKWNRDYDTNYGSPRWPAWMEKLPECD